MWEICDSKLKWQSGVITHTVRVRLGSWEHVGSSPTYRSSIERFNIALDVPTVIVGENTQLLVCGSRSIGRALAFQAGRCEFESRLPLHNRIIGKPLR